MITLREALEITVSPSDHIDSTPVDWNGSQAPCIGLFNQTDLTVGFTMRDKEGYSRPAFIKIPIGIFTGDVVEVSMVVKPIQLPELKGPYKHGLILSQILEDGYLLSGWENQDGTKARWKVTPLEYVDGVMTDLQEERLVEDFPNGVSMPFYGTDDLYFMGFCDWVRLDGRLEPYYSIGIDDGEVNLPVLQADKCYCRPVEFNGPKGKELWYCSRNLSRYKENSKDAYKLGILRLINNQWVPVNHEISIEFDSFQIAYPYPFTLENRVFMLYNGDKSMRGDIQVAEVFYD